MNINQNQKAASPATERVCPPDHVHLFDNFLRPLVHSPSRLFGPHVKPGMKALDIGCGRGFASLGLARMVGKDGHVVAADLQPEMLEMVAERVEKSGLSDRIRLHRCEADKIGLGEKFDFVLAFWMAHETPDPSRFLREVYSLLNPDGRFFLAEPKMHISKDVFRDFVAEAEEIGFKPLKNPFVLFSRAIVMVKSQ